MDLSCVFIWTTTLDLPPFPVCCWAGAWKPMIGQSFTSTWKKLHSAGFYQLDQFLYKCSIFVVLISYIRPPCNRGVVVFLPCSSLQFSLLPERTYSTCVSPQVFRFLFCKQRNILRAVLISFKQSSSTWSGSFSPHLEHVCCPLQASQRCPYFWYLKYLWVAGTYCLTLPRQ